jgi:hypothetical protein
MRLRLQLGLFLLFGAFLSSQTNAATATPAVFYTDLVSGPSTGGASNNGVIVTINGNNFGSTRGSSTVTFGGGAVATYPTWSNTQIQVAIGAGAKSGAVVVNVNGQASNCVNRDPGGCNFTVRSGNIYFVSPSGSDSGQGSFTSPWQTLFHAVRSVSAGDTIYGESGVNISAPDGTGWHSALLLTTAYMKNGASGDPIAIVAYPGATVTIGSNAPQTAGGDTTLYGLRTDGSINNFVVSGITLRGPSRALSVEGGSYWRLVNTDSSAGDPSLTEGGGVQFSQTTQVQYYGNNVHDVGGDVKLEHALYFGTDTNHVWAGWNLLQNNTTCYSLQFHSSPVGSGTGNDQYDLHVHDNFFTGDRCAGLNFATVDPSKGTVEAYNNVFNHVGIGPTPSDGAWVYTCIYAAGILNNGPAPSGTVQIYNNTTYDCGSGGQVNTAYAFGPVVIQDQGSGAGIKYNLTNNILDEKSGASPYIIFYGSATPSYATCSNNLFYGNGAGPTGCSQDVNANPLFVGTTGSQLHLQSSSPALGAATSAFTPGWDFAGFPRPSPHSIGAYELDAAGTTAALPATPVDIVVTVK